MLTCSEAKLIDKQTEPIYEVHTIQHPKGGTITVKWRTNSISEWCEPEKYIEGTGNCYAGDCNRCGKNRKLYGMVVDRWRGCQVCEPCIRELEQRFGEEPQTLEWR